MYKKSERDRESQQEVDRDEKKVDGDEGREGRTPRAWRVRFLPFLVFFSSYSSFPSIHSPPLSQLQSVSTVIPAYDEMIVFSYEELTRPHYYGGKPGPTDLE